MAFLLRKGIPEKAARSLLGQLRKAAGDVATGALLTDAAAQDISDPAPWLMKAAANARTNRANGETHASPAKLSAAERVLANAMRGELADAERDATDRYRVADLVGAHG